MKKYFYLIILIVSFLLSCGAQKEEGATEGNKQVITLWHYFFEPDVTHFLAYIDKYNESQDKYFVKPQFIPREELLKQYAMGSVAGELPDIGMLDNPDQAYFSKAGLFEDITDRFNAWDDNKFLDGAINSAIYDGKIYGLPISINCLALFYDKDAFEENNLEVPTNWTQLEEAAKVLTTADRKGIAWSGIKNEEGTFQLLPWIISAGGNINKINSPECVKALTFLTDLVKNGYASQELLVLGQSDLDKSFNVGKTAMMINGPWIMASIRKNAPDKNWGVAKIPMDKQYASVLGGENFAIIKDKNIEGAWDFLTWFLSTEVSQNYCKDIEKFSPKVNVDIDTMYGDDPIMKVFADQIKYAMPRGPHPKWPEISSIIINAEHESITFNKTPQQALDEAQAKIDEINASIN
ncbi:ABC transporter substrate-binding protein [Brachyspira pilosicoli]|uniref:ABC transporter substrate-binding protein n=1 Tax=Brachyspira pilosicoli TaxID=52584 RepID=UPI0030076567